MTVFRGDMDGEMAKNPKLGNTQGKRGGALRIGRTVMADGRYRAHSRSRRWWGRLRAHNVQRASKNRGFDRLGRCRSRGRPAKPRFCSPKIEAERLAAIAAEQAAAAP